MTDPFPRLETRVDELLPTRESLLLRLKNWEDQESWQDFFTTYWQLIYSVALKAGLEGAAAEDVVQETIIGVAKGIGSFQYDSHKGSFKGWLLTITRRRITDHLRKRYAEPDRLQNSYSEDDGMTPLLNRVPDCNGFAWEKIWDEEWERNLFHLALEKVKLRVKPRQYQLFDCFVLKEWSMTEVTEKLRVNQKQVYFAKCKLTLLLRGEMRALKRRWDQGGRHKYPIVNEVH